MTVFWRLVVCVGAACLTRIGAAQDSSRTLFVVSGPDVLHAETATHLAVTIHGSLPVSVTAEVTQNDSVLAIQERQFQGGSTGVLTLPPISRASAKPHSRVTLTVSGHQSNQLVFTKSNTIDFDIRHVSAFVQTDRSRYQPGDTIRVRVASVRMDNSPYTGPVDISILDPAKNVVQMSTLSGGLGVALTEFVLSPSSPAGRWTVAAEVNGLTDEREVLVKQFESPPFDVLVKTASRVLVGAAIAGSARALYPDGLPVKGKLSISVSLVSALSLQPFTLTQTKELYGSTHFFFSKDQLQALLSQANAGADGNYVARVTTTVTDTSTGLKVEESVEVIFLRSAFQLKFSNFPTTVKPSLKFSAKLKISRYDGQPLTSSDLMFSAMVEVTQSGSKMASEHKTITIPVPEDGNVHIGFTLQDQVETLFIHARFKSSEQTLQLNNHFSSPSGSYIQISAVNSLPARVGLPLQMKVESTFQPTTTHFVVSSRGQVLTAGTNPPSSFFLTPALSWYPEACVTVYCVLPDGEVTGDTVHIPIHQHNNVSLSWSSNSAQPGDQVSLTVTVAEPSSQVGILVIAADGIALEMEEDGKVEKGCNIRMLSNALLQMNRMPYPTKDEGDTLVVERYWRHWMDQDDTESWLWLDANVSDTTWTSMKVTVPDRITSWRAVALVMSNNLGLGFTPLPKQLEVTKDFSLSLEVPYFLIRGEEIVLEVKISNHLERTIEVIVLVAQSDAYEFVLADQNDISVVNAQKRILDSHETSSILFPIRPLTLGEIDITVDAVSAEDVESLVRSVLVKPEGVEQTFSKSLFLELAPVMPNNSVASSFSFPPDVVPGSQRAHVAVVGDIMGLSINNLNSLVQRPRECGEQNMILFAPSLYILQYLDKTSADFKEIETQALGNMREGYRRQLSYQRDDGSFSAFGASDASGSIWLTAFVLRCFLQAKQYVLLDQSVLTRATGWLLGHQGPEGEFTEVGQLIHTEMQGGFDGDKVALTAYVLIALLEDESNAELFQNSVSLATKYLEDNLSSGTVGNYSLCLVAYALVLARSPEANTAMFELTRRADHQDGIKMWSSSTGLDSDGWHPRSAQIEMTAYVLLALFSSGNVLEGIQPMKWLSKQRDHLGGFGTTQDTVVALQALSNYAEFSGASAINVKIKMSMPAASSVTYFSINSSSYLMYQRQQIPVAKDLLINLYMEGRGFSLFQMNVFYNRESRAFSRAGGDGDAFALVVDAAVDDHDHMLLSICTRLKEDQAISHTGMAMLEVGLLSGFILAPGALPPKDLIRKVEATYGKVNLYLDSLTKTEVCIRLPLVRQYKVAHVMDAVIMVYDYYEPMRKATVVYNSDHLHKMNSCSFCGADCSQCRAAFTMTTFAASPNSATYSLNCLLAAVTAFLLVA